MSTPATKVVKKAPPPPPRTTSAPPPVPKALSAAINNRNSADRERARAVAARVAAAAEDDDDDDEDDDEDYQPPDGSDSGGSGESGEAEEEEEEEEEEGEGDSDEDYVSEEGADMDADPVDEMDEGEAAMELTMNVVSLDNDNVGENDVHDLRGKERKTNYYDQPITHTQHDVSALFHDELSRYALKMKTQILSGEIADALKPVELKDMKKAGVAAGKFRKALKALQLSILERVLADKVTGGTALALLYNKLKKCSEMRIVVLADMIEMVPAVGNKDELSEDVVTQQTIVAKKAAFVQLKEKTKTLNTVVSNETLAFVLAIYFIENLESLIRYKCSEYMVESFEADCNVMPEAIFNKYICIDARQVIPMYARYFLRQVKRLSIAFPKLAIPQTIAEDLA